MGEVERKVDMLISGIKTPKKKTRGRVATLATTMLIAIALLAGASLINVYYVQTGTVDITSLITITEPDGVTTHDAGWTESITIGGGENPVFYEGTTYIHPGDSKYYTITNNADTMKNVYYDIVVTEMLSDGITTGDGLGLTVELVCVGGADIADGQIYLGNGDNGDPDYANFEIHVTAAEHINAASTYTYTITMDWYPPIP